MKKHFVAGLLLLTAGCGPAMTAGGAADGVNADSLPDGWYNSKKTAAQLSEDMAYCRALCGTA